MLRRRVGWIGIDIGSRSVKVAQVERGPVGRLRLRQGAVIARRTPWPDLEGLDAPAAPSAPEIVAAINCGHRFSGHQAACTLPMHLYGFRGLHIPPGSHEERRNMISGGLDDEWDARRKACEFDFWETDCGDTKLRQDEPNVNVLAVSQRWTDQITRDAAKSSLRLQVLDGPPLAMARAVQLVAQESQAPEAAIDWGYTSTTFCVVQGGRALFTRRVRSCGLRLVCESIGASLGVSREETQHVLLTFGLPGNEPADPPYPLQEAMADAAAQQLARLADEVVRTLAYFRAQRRELTPERIWLMGGGASIPGAANWLSAACEIPVRAWRISESLDAPESGGVSAHPPDTSTTNEPLLAEAIALSALPLFGP